MFKRWLLEITWLKCLWSKKWLLLIWKAFQSKEELRFLFGNIVFLCRDIYVFVLCKWGNCLRRMGGSTKTVQYSIKNISSNIGEVFFNLGTRNVHYKRNLMTPTMSLHGNTLGSSPFLWKTKYLHFQCFKSGTEGLARHTNGSHIALIIPIRLLWVDDPCLG